MTNLKTYLVSRVRQKVVFKKKKHSGSIPRNACVAGQTDRQTPDKVIPMCHYASQATQKWPSVGQILHTVFYRGIRKYIGSIKKVVLGKAKPIFLYAPPPPSPPLVKHCIITSEYPTFFLHLFYLSTHICIERVQGIKPQHWDKTKTCIKCTYQLLTFTFSGWT